MVELANPPLLRRPDVAELRNFARVSVAPRMRTLRNFAEQEIVLPMGGRFAGFHFRCHRQPYSGHWFDAIDSGLFNKAAAFGPVQSGKTLTCIIIPLLWHLFEWAETVIFGLPDMNMASDKWRNDILPVIERSQYASLLPRTGRGSRGGAFDSVQFRHGPSLKFMSGGGGDAKRSSYTSRVVFITEVDKMDQPGKASREADPISQIIARTDSWDDMAMVYLECTVSIEEGRIYQEWKNGSQGRIALRCPHCHAFVHIVRKDLKGWENAESDHEAGDKGRIECPSCDAPWSEGDRVAANESSVIVHRGQTVNASGKVKGKMPRTSTLGFRWNAAHNMLKSMERVSMKEHEARTSSDEETAERLMCQFVWAIPWIPPAFDTSKLTQTALMSRFSTLKRGILPEGTVCLTVGMDPHKYQLYWFVVAWLSDGSSRVVDYGLKEVHSDDFPIEVATLAALREFRDDYAIPGWMKEGGGKRSPDALFIDMGWEVSAPAVVEFLKESATMSGYKQDGRDGAPYRPMIGRGHGQVHHARYVQPKKRTRDVMFLGTEYHVTMHRHHKVCQVIVNSDYWKTFLHERLASKPDTPGAMTLFQTAEKNEHFKLTMHLTAEQPHEIYDPGRGTVRVWKNVRKANHYLDCAYMACTAAHLAGVQILGSDVEADETPQVVRDAQPPLTTPDGRPFIITERT